MSEAGNNPTAVPNRHRIRFGLRTLFVMLTALGLWLAWQSSNVAGRRIVLNEAMALHDKEILTWTRAATTGDNQIDAVLVAVSTSEGCLGLAGPNAGQQISFVRRLLGDEAIGFAVFFDEREFEKFSARFPEARVLLFKDQDSYLAAKRAWATAIPPNQMNPWQTPEVSSTR